MKVNTFCSQITNSLLTHRFSLIDRYLITNFLSEPQNQIFASLKIISPSLVTHSSLIHHQIITPLFFQAFGSPGGCKASQTTKIRYVLPPDHKKSIFSFSGPPKFNTFALHREDRQTDGLTDRRTDR